VFLLRSIANLHLALCQTVCKPGSVPPKSGDGHSSGTFVAERLARPTRAAARKARPAARLSPHRLPLLLGLAPGGVYPAAAVAGGAVRSYRTISPLPPAGPTNGTGWARRYVFCGTFPGVAPAGRYPAPCLRGARTFLPPLKSETWTESGHPTVWRGKIWDAAPHLSNRTCRSHGAARRTSAIKRRADAALSPRR
jgi:hypothetical protein